MLKLLKKIYPFVLIISLSYLLFSCCPGAKNIVYPQFYTAQNLILNSCSPSCMESKTSSAWKTRPNTWEAYINDRDFITYTYDNDTMTYFHIQHHADYERMRQLFNEYNSYFKKNGKNYKYIRGNSFQANFYGWEIFGHLSSNDMSITARDKGYGLQR